MKKIILMTFLIMLSSCSQINPSNSNSGINISNSSCITDENNINGSLFIYKFENDGCTITGYNGSETIIEIPSSIDGIKVKSIGENAFRDNILLTSITIPNSVTRIGEYAFYGCDLLTIYCEANSKPSEWDTNWNCGRPIYWGINEGNYLVQNGIIYVIQNEEAVVTGHEANITNVVIPETIAAIKVTSIGYKAFSHCSSLTSIVISNSVTRIGEYAFYGCNSLTSLVILNGVTNIGIWAFSGCNSLTTLVIPNSVTSIGGYAFYLCSSLTSIEIPNSVTRIGEYAFYGCDSLTIYCEANSKPGEWDTNWNSSNIQIVWGYKG